jgi:hypothetical protein
MKKITAATLIKPAYPIEYPNNNTYSSTSYKEKK